MYFFFIYNCERGSLFKINIVYSVLSNGHRRSRFPMLFRGRPKGLDCLVLEWKCVLLLGWPLGRPIATTMSEGAKPTRDRLGTNIMGGLPHCKINSCDDTHLEATDC